MAEDENNQEFDVNKFLVKKTEGKLFEMQWAGDALGAGTDLITGAATGYLRMSSHGLIDLESTADARRKYRSGRRDSAGLKANGIGGLTEGEAKRLGILSSAEFASNDQCVLLEMAKKIYDYAARGGTPETLSAPPPMTSAANQSAIAQHLASLTGGSGDRFGGVVQTPKIASGDAKTGAVKSISQLGSTYKNNYDVIRRITLHRKSTRFLEITPQQVAQLSPLIYLSVDYYDKSGNRVRRIPLDFPNKVMLKENILQSSGRRFGGGIKDITITHEGIDSATEKIVLIDSSFVFQDFRTAAQGNYEELLKIGTRGSDSNLRRYINFEFGWDSNAKTAASHGGLALSSMRTHVRGELVKYTFDFAEDGSIILKTQHRGHLHTIFGDTPAANVLSAQKAAEESLRAGAVQIISANKSKLIRDNKNSLRHNMLDEFAIKVANEAVNRFELDALGNYKENLDKYAKGAVDLQGAEGDLNLDTSQVTMDMLTKKNINLDPAHGAALTSGEKTPFTQNDLDMINSKAQDILKEAYKRAVAYDRSQFGATKVEVLARDALQMRRAIRERSDHNKVQNKEIQDNLAAKNIHQFAQAQFNKKVGLLRFTSLFNLASTLSQKQKVYYGAIDGETRLSIASTRAYKPGLQEVFGRIQAQGFLTAPRKIGADPVFQNMLQNKDIQGAQMAIATALTKTTTFPFVFLGDFLQTILETPATLGSLTGTMFELMKETAGVDIEILLGYLSYETPFAGQKVHNLPLYYLPISLRKLNYFITREIVGKDRVFYSFGALIKDLIKKLIDTAFYNCIRESGTGESPLTPKLDYATGEHEGRDVFFIYDSKQFVNDMKGKNFGSYRNNLRLKIPHFYLGGPDKGIAQKIQLRDIADPSLKAAVYYKQSPSNADSKEGTAGPEHGRWAPTVFEAQVDTLGYPNFQLGQLVFIDARQFVGASAQKNFMATGYYGIHKIVHKLSPDSFTTTINGIIQMSEKDKDRINSEASAADPSTAKGQPADESDPTDLNFTDMGRAATEEELERLKRQSKKWEETQLLAEDEAAIERLRAGMDALKDAGVGADFEETKRRLTAKLTEEKKAIETKEQLKGSVGTLADVALNLLSVGGWSGRSTLTGLFGN
tara:strand:- start:4687 stop:8046 length:3360 start_codon:yes stop_codon:yes gene_type:complete